MVRKSRWLLFRKKRWLALAIGLATVLVVGVLELTNTTYLFHKKTVPATIPAATETKKSEEKKKAATEESTQDQSKDGGDKVATSTAGGRGAPLIEPYGSLVSNHRPGQNGSDTKEQSVCNTTPGAICYIQFKNMSDGKTTRLPNQTVGSDGSALWSWDAKTLTAGTWEVSATASLNGQTKSVTDSIRLEIP